ncbi:MAG: hypothetical protein HYV07_17015 [Deltaproteobacteria bacterium]|nr:hypothetical protein [Deltaproteobacteria bacterium]
MAWIETIEPRDAQGDLAELRRAGHDDRAILDAALTVAYFSFVNRLVLLLGVAVEDDFASTCAGSDEEA